MSDDGQLLLAAILAFPDEDTPRLVYADWLEENGQPERAEFIRVQIELTKRKVTKRDCEKGQNILDRKREGSPVRWNSKSTATLLAKQHDLFGEMGMAGFPSIKYQNSVQAKFHRGFCNELSITWEAWKEAWATILAAHPVRKVTLMTYPFQQENVVRGRPRDELELELLYHEWPKIEFELPREENLFMSMVGDPTNYDYTPVAADPEPTYEPPL